MPIGNVTVLVLFERDVLIFIYSEHAICVHKIGASFESNAHSMSV
jgi:hypothetical protein